jgi:hypothetical protein
MLHHLCKFKLKKVSFANFISESQQNNGYDLNWFQYCRIISLFLIVHSDQPDVEQMTLEELRGGGGPPKQKEKKNKSKVVLCLAYIQISQSHVHHCRQVGLYAVYLLGNNQKGEEFQVLPPTQLLVMQGLALPNQFHNCYLHPKL